MIRWLGFEKKPISILAGNLNSSRSYLITAVALGKYCQSFITSSLNYDVWYVVAKGASIYLWKIMDYKHAYFFVVIPFFVSFSSFSFLNYELKIGFKAQFLKVQVFDISSAKHKSFFFDQSTKKNETI